MQCLCALTTLCVLKIALNSCLYLCQILTDFQNPVIIIWMVVGHYDRIDTCTDNAHGKNGVVSDLSVTIM